MEQRLMKYIDLLMERYPILAECKDDIIAVYEIMEECYRGIINSSSLVTPD